MRAQRMRLSTSFTEAPAGFLPHLGARNVSPFEAAYSRGSLDHPSLAFYAPPHFSHFITVMVAVDDMSEGPPCGGWGKKEGVTLC